MESENIKKRSFFHFLDWYASSLKESYETGLSVEKNGKYEEIDSCEEFMLRYTMKLIYWERWIGKTG